MASPSRPSLKRADSKVRFSRGSDMSPIGTMASDSTVHGVHGQHSRPSPQQQQNYPQYPQDHNQNQTGKAYDINSYPFSEEISLCTSDAAPPQHTGGSGAYYREIIDHGDEEDELHPYDSESQRDYRANESDNNNNNNDDGFTTTPPRIGGRQWNSAQQRPTPATRLTANAIDLAQSISPRGSTIVGGFEPQPTSPYQGSLQARPSALRSSLAMPSHPASPHRSPQARDPQNFDAPGTPSRIANIRSSVPNLMHNTTPRRVLEQHRHSAPETGSPVMGSPHFGSPQFGASPHNSPNPGRRYPEYEAPPPDRFSPVPPYQSPRNSWNQRSGGNGDWDQHTHRNNQVQYAGRHDSDATLQVDYQEKKPSGNDRYQDGGKMYRRARSASEDSSRSILPSRDGKDKNNSMRRRTTREVEDDDEGTYQVKGGVFSQLLRLTGRSATLRRRMSSRGASSQGGGDLPTMKTLGLKRRDSTASTVFGADELDPDDPRVTGQKKKKGRRNSWSELPFTRTASMDGSADPKKKRRASISFHVADILTRQKFILKLAKSLMAFGAPSHRIESQLAATALVLEIDAQFIHFPSIVIASFGDHDTRTSETHFVKSGGGLDLGKLHRVHNIYRAVVHDQLDAGEGTRRIHDLLKAPMQYNLWQRMCIAFLCSGIICPLGFGGSFIDGLASGALGILLSFMQLHVASKSAMYSNIFEISIATIISFTARGLSATGIFCYQSVASAGVVLILPGYTILCGSLELASKNIVSGSVRMVYAIIYSLFLGFGITIGSDLFYVIDRPARRAAQTALAAATNTITIQGVFNPTGLPDSAMPDASLLVPFNGTFTFTNGSSDDYSSSLQHGSIICPRPDGLPWFRQSMPRIYLIALVPVFSLMLSLWNMQPLRSRQLPVMVVIACIGYLTNSLANHYIFDRSDVVSAIGAFVVGILGNVYSRAFGGTAFTSMATGVLFLVPSGIAAAGGLAMTTTAHRSDSYSQGLIIGFRMVQVAIGITVGLFGSGLLIYSFGRKKGAALFAF